MSGKKRDLLRVLSPKNPPKTKRSSEALRSLRIVQSLRWAWDTRFPRKAKDGEKNTATLHKRRQHAYPSPRGKKTSPERRGGIPIEGHPESLP